jgi:hypothetical protein
LAEVINALSTNPYGIEYEFYFKPDIGLRITRLQNPQEHEALSDENEALFGAPTTHIN